jgi:hypothetical protein
MARRRRWEEELEERERSPKPTLARLDEGKRVGVLEELQRAGGNSALQRVVGAELQRDTATATRPGRPSAPGAVLGDWALSVDGTVVGPVRSVEGLDLKADVISTEHPSGNVSKHIGAPSYTPAVLTVGLGMKTGFYDWIRAVLDRKQVTKDIVLHHVDRATGQTGTELELTRALVTAVEVPQLGAGKGEAWLKITVAPEAVRRTTGSGAKVETKLDPLDPATARLEVEGMGSVSGIQAIGPWAARQLVKEDPRSGARAAKTDFDDLVLTLADGAKGASAFDAWAQDAVIGGNSGKSSERTAVLTVTTKGGKKLELSFSGVGIFSAEQIARGGGRKYGLYVSGASLRVV